jgi:glutamine cyclotransferase
MRHDPDDNMRTTHTTAPLEPSHLFGEGISHYHVWTTTTDGSDDDDDDDDDDDGSSGGGGRERRKRRARRRRKEHRLIQLTWTSKVGRVYSLPELTPLREFEFDTSTGEGWGITFVSHRNEFYVSDGSEYLSVWDADTLAEKRRIVVTFEGGGGGGGGENAKRRIRHLNELEFVDFAVVAPDCDDDDDYSRTATEGGGGNDNDVWWCAETGTTTCSDDDEGSSSPSSFSPTMAILANLWYQDVLVSIDPESGEINRVFDLRDIYPKDMREEDGSDCLNGISVTGRRRKSNDEGLEVWVTGKLWPSMYRIELNVDLNYII